MCKRKDLESLMMENDGLVHHVVRSVFAVYPMDNRYDDCVQEGRLAMCEALLKYDPEKTESKLVNILYTVIKQRLYSFLNKGGVVKVSHRSITKRTAINRKLAKGEVLSEDEEAFMYKLNNAVQGYADYDSIGDNLELATYPIENLDLWMLIDSYTKSLNNALKEGIITDYFTQISNNEKPNLHKIAAKYDVTAQYASLCINKAKATLQTEIMA